jgi:N utilization substance protein A
MNNELHAILSYMEKERGIDRDVLIKAVEFALQSVARKSSSPEQEVRVEIDRKTYQIREFGKAVVVAAVPRNKHEIALDPARRIKADAQVGEVVEVELPPGDFSRIAAQTAKQAILQKIRQAEREIVVEEFKSQIGKIISGTIRQFSHGEMVVDLGRAEGVMNGKDRVPTEDYVVGDRIRALVVEIQPNAAGPAVILSRTHNDFIVELFKLEVAEIADGVVTIKGIAREPGSRTKIAVASSDAKVDPVGACVGMRGMRVKNIVRELSGEKIDIIRWSDDLRTCAANALAPAKFTKVVIDPEDPRVVHVTVEPDQLSLAIGKRGQNVRLSAKLLGVKIDIQKDEASVSFEEKVAKAVAEMAALPGIGKENAEKLVAAGFLTVEGILAADVGELAEAAGFDAETAKNIFETAAAQTADHEEAP